MKILINWLIIALVIMIGAYILPGVNVTDFWSAFVAAAILGLLNAFLKPLIIILTLPINILTLGLFTLVINTLILMLVSAIVPGVVIASFWSALIFSIVISLFNIMLGQLKKQD
ncbi:MAG: hypothetical protein A3A24_01735 [Candidatus Buchananbacteria bacterium RIFCSPLOWO2_01_FULL_46_12]|uniref:Phage holin family protein n=2 Tax=Candidatus Buchananiibacteriota TaxID=1817903 RepID=A0A1G1YMH6_9BACT|nr:MAG: hypothetical protein A2744_02950 [Candidatus Buchananbacteria bacterium RIFCSPHIGHO2_01_FULL_44_11]OGY53484.1 MAG: hypothetical protein A3A24_01735 [Candidatus Buchananbacteria bacterium RIFCSPLOWO2_01_FULL_46_12]